jgi:nucleoside-diphosphate-sugar epimerase
MRVLVTGATGFIGSHVTRRLVADGCEVTALVSPGADTTRIADVIPSIRRLDGNLMSSLAPVLTGLQLDACLHLAWYAVPGVYLTAPENLEHLKASVDLLRLLPETGCRRVVGAGTCFEYDLETAAETLSETSPVRPHTLYAACKHALATVGERWCKLAGMSWAWGRIFYPYGPADDPRKLVPTLVRELTAGRPCDLTMGEQIRDYIHVADVADAFWRLLRSPHEGPIAIGSGQPVTVRHIASTVADRLGRADLLRFGARVASPGDPARVCADNRVLRGLGWEPSHDLASGLAETVAWWQGYSPGP